MQVTRMAHHSSQRLKRHWQAAECRGSRHTHGEHTHGHGYEGSLPAVCSLQMHLSVLS